MRNLKTNNSWSAWLLSNPVKAHDLQNQQQKSLNGILLQSPHLHKQTKTWRKPQKTWGKCLGHAHCLLSGGLQKNTGYLVFLPCFCVIFRLAHFLADLSRARSFARHRMPLHPLYSRTQNSALTPHFAGVMQFAGQVHYFRSRHSSLYLGIFMNSVWEGNEISKLPQGVSLSLLLVVLLSNLKRVKNTTAMLIRRENHLFSFPPPALLEFECGSGTPLNCTTSSFRALGFAGIFLGKWINLRPTDPKHAGTRLCSLPLLSITSWHPSHLHGRRVNWLWLTWLES